MYGIIQLFFILSFSLFVDSYLCPGFQGLVSDNDTARLGLDFQRMLRINHILYIAARSVSQSTASVLVHMLTIATN